MSIPKTSLSETISGKRPISFSGLNVTQIKVELTAQLNDKEKRMGEKGISQISRKALFQQAEVIRKELVELNQYEQEQELPDNIRSKLEDLANEVQYLKSSKSTSLHDAKQTIGFSPLLPPPPTNSSPSKQRTKTTNGNRRNPDIEFATEIGQGLLIEVRKLQAALQEKDEIIKHLELSKSDNERNYESTQRHLKQREEIEERLKEENWNLEVANQELRATVSESNQLVAKHNTEFTKLAKKLKSQSEQIDIMKAQEEKSASVIEAIKARHEQETFHLRRHAASAQRDNTQLQKQLDTLNTELKICKAKLAVKLAASSRTTEDAPIESDTSETTLDTASSTNNNTTQSTTSNTRNQVMETETLKQSLAHAHRIISNLRSSLHKEKLEKFEVKKMLSDSQENIEQLRKEMSSWNTNNTVSFSRSKKPVTKKKRGGVARRGRGSDKMNEERGEEEPSEKEEQDESTDDDKEDYENLGFSFGSTPFTSVPMMPLSSELENKVHVIDVGINTDPFDSLVARIIKERQDIAQRAESILSPEQIELLLPKESRQWNASVETVEMIPQEQVQIMIEEATQKTRAEFDDMITKQKALVEEQMVPKQQVEVLLQEAKHKTREEYSDMVPKQEVATLLRECEQRTKNEFSDMMTKQQVDMLVQKTRQEFSEMVPKQQVDTMLNEAKEKSARELAEMRSNVESELKETMTPKERVQVLLDEVRLEGKLELEKNLNELRKTQDEIKQAVEKEMEQQTQLAVEEAVQKTKAELETTIRSEEALRQSMDMVPKSQVDTLLDKMRAEMLQDESREKLRSAIEEELKQDMVPRSEIDRLVEEAKQQTREQVSMHDQEIRAVIEKELKETMMPKSQVDALISETQNTIREEMKAETAAATEQIKHQHQQEFESKLSETIASETEKAQVALEQQKSELETARLNDLEAQKALMDQQNKEALEQIMVELEAAKTSELETCRNTHQTELEQKQQEHQENLKSELEKHKKETNEMLEKAAVLKKNEMQVLSSRIESQKQEYDELKQRMLTMLTKDSADVLIRRAVAEAVENAEKKHTEAMSGMISREYSTRMTNDEVEKALEKERKKVAEREEQFMISKTEAEALAKVAAADAIVKERQAMAAREKELITKEEAERMTQAAVKEACDVQKNEAAATLAKEKKLMKEQMISKEEAEKNTAEAVRLALIDYKTKDSLDTPVPTQFNEQVQELRNIERSVSTSRLSPPAVNISPAPSVSTPASSSRKLRLSNSVSSLRLGNQAQKSSRKSTDSSGSAFGSLRILETSKYTSPRLQSKSSVSLRDLSKKQTSSTSISTISSNDEQVSLSSQMQMPMSSNESLPVFSSSGGTDMDAISSITQTMIGEWMSKHTRRYVGGGISENKHQRFFWVHPYTRILYWSSAQPGAEGSQAKTKNAYIESVTSVRSNDAYGSSPKSLLIRTPKRDIKITAASLERHELWLKSLNYLLGRSSSVNSNIQEESHSATSSFVDPQQNTVSSKASNLMLADAVQYDSDDSEDMVNLRQCCDGKHDISTLSRGSHHHHH